MLFRSTRLIINAFTSNAKKAFPHRDSNPGLLGESQLSEPPRLCGKLVVTSSKTRLIINTFTSNAEKAFPHRDSNPGLLGESQLSQPPRICVSTAKKRNCSNITILATRRRHSNTGTRTRVCWVRPSYRNRQEYARSMSSLAQKRNRSNITKLATRRRHSNTGTRTRVCWVRASYPNRQEYVCQQQKNEIVQTLLY